MPNETVQYKCPACTGPLHYAQDSGKLECEFCGSAYTPEEIEALQKPDAQKAAQAFEEAPEEQENWVMSQAGSDWGADEKKLRAYSCPNCGAELICEETTAATSCPYCGNPTVIPGNLSGARKPDYIIPFVKTREDAVAALTKHYSHRPILPRSFMKDSHIQEVKGVYVPFWLFDAKVDADMTFNAPRCHSDQLFKYVAEGDSRCAFEGLIRVGAGAHHTEAYQNNRNMLASRGARMHTRPQLEIYCDDVRANHGAATGQLDNDALFYMQTRGIPREQARTMLMQAFMSDVIDSMSPAPLRERMRQLVSRRLGNPGDDGALCATCGTANDGPDAL